LPAEKWKALLEQKLFMKIFTRHAYTGRPFGKALHFLLIHKKMEAEPGIEPRFTALQAVALLYVSMGCALCHLYYHSNYYCLKITDQTSH